MARKVEGFLRRQDGRHSRSQYPWDEWLDGSVWEVEMGIDFDLTMHNFRRIVQQAGRARGGITRTEVIGERMRFQFVKPDN